MDIETYERCEGLSFIKDTEAFDASVKSIISELEKEDFDELDIKHYLVSRILKLKK